MTKQTFWGFSVPLFVYNDADRFAKSLQIAQTLYQKRFQTDAPDTYTTQQNNKSVLLQFPLPQYVDQQLTLF